MRYFVIITDKFITLQLRTACNILERNTSMLKTGEFINLILMIRKSDTEE